MLRIKLLEKYSLLHISPNQESMFSQNCLPLFYSYTPRHQLTEFLLVIFTVLNVVFKAVIAAALILDCLVLTSSTVLCPFIIFSGNIKFALSS